MTVPAAMTYTLVTEAAQFHDVCAALARERRIAVDTEADSMHHYPERVCLVQVATPEHTYLLDPLALRDLSPLSDALGDRRVLKLLHGADYDLRGLNRDWGLTFAGLFDTYIAARFLGMERVGLAALLEELLAVEIPKDRRIQRADWSKRPLDDVALQYAAADVCHLFALHDAMADKLRLLGRLPWVAEECERLCEVRHTPQDLTETVLSQSSARKFDGRQLAVLLALYRHRENEARRLDRPPSHVLPPAALTAIAAEPRARLEDVDGLTPRQVKRFGRTVRAAVREGLNGPPLVRPRTDDSAATQADAGAGAAAARAEGVAQRAGEGPRHGHCARVAHAQPGAAGPGAADARRGAGLAGGTRLAARPLFRRPSNAYFRQNREGPAKWRAPQ